MKRSQFIQDAQSIIERVDEISAGIADWEEEITPEEAAEEIADLLPKYIWEDEKSPPAEPAG